MLQALLVALCMSVACASFKAAPYPSWAHSHWVWQNGASQSQDSLQNMVREYIGRGIPVGALNIDSSWSTGYSNFIWNRTRFPDPKGLINGMHQQGIRVIAWASSVIDITSSNYAEAKEKGYLLNDGQVIRWWRGHGSFLDYRNKEAVDWWHQQMDPVLELGLDGWKCDGTDPLLIFYRPWPYSGKSKKNLVRYREYANDYYGDFFNYTRTKRPESLLMARPVDNYRGKYFFSYAPKYLMFSGWVGDEVSNYEGMRIALKNMYHSAWKNYLNFGCDIGGYAGGQVKVAFLRYAQLGAMLPLMENGGNGKHFPWAFDEETVDVYRAFAVLHTDLTPFFLTAGTEAFAKGVSVMQPLATKQGRWAPHDPDNWGYLLWKDLLVFPLLNDAGIAEVNFPTGSEWVYYFNHSKGFSENTKIEAMFPLSEFPVFLRKGATIPFTGRYFLVYPEGQLSRTIYHGDWSDELTYSCGEERLELLIERSYRPGFQGPAETSTIVDLLGVESDTPSELGTNGWLEQGVLRVRVELNRPVVLSGLRFSRFVASTSWS